jgi:putative FmdB family regulatory protein
MPFYEYQCSACKAHHEELQKITDGPLRKCPSCGRNTLRRLVSAPVFRLKGGGWYETDFKADKEGKRNLAGDKEPASSEASSGGTPPASADAKAKDEKPGAKPATDAVPARPAAEAAVSAPVAAKPAKDKSPAAGVRPKSPTTGARARAHRRSRR